MPAAQFQLVGLRQQDYEEAIICKGDVRNSIIMIYTDARFEHNSVTLLKIECNFA